jgi:Domain of unknown function (DUF4288)
LGNGARFSIHPIVDAVNGFKCSPKRSRSLAYVRTPAFLHARMRRHEKPYLPLARARSRSLAGNGEGSVNRLFPSERRDKTAKKILDLSKSSDATAKSRGNYLMTADSKKNKCFAVLLLFRSLRNGEYTSASLWEESLILVYADTEAEAEQKAIDVGKTRAIKYMTVDGVEVTWEFFEVEQTYSIEDDLSSSGVEIFSRHLRASEAESLLVPFDN